MTVPSTREHVTFDVKGLLQESWEVYRANLATYLGAFIFYLVIVVLGDYKLWVAGTILNGPLLMGLMKMAQCGARQEPVRFGDLFIGFEYFLPALLLGVISHILVGPMGIFFIGLAAFFLLLPAFLFILEMECGTKCALGTAWDMIRGNIREWLFLSVVLAFVLLVGFLLTAPLCMIAVAKAYDLERGTCCSKPHPCPKEPASLYQPGGDMSGSA